MFNLPFDPNKPIAGKASVVINRSIEEVFKFVGENFFDNYPLWATDVVEFNALDGKQVVVGAKAQQLRKDKGKPVSSVFQINAYQPYHLISSKGLTSDYQDSYTLEQDGHDLRTKLTYTFELLNVELFMQPFEKLIRVAIEDGAEATAENIKNLLA